MSITYGFYNSMNHDRKYNALQISKMFDGIIKDGVFMSIDGCFAVTAGSGMSVIVAPGKAWFNHTWTQNDADLPITVYQSEAVLNRIDALVLEVDSTDNVRANSIKFIKGTPSSNPVIPSLINTASVHQHLLCTVTVPAGSTEILGSMITNYVGTITTPFVSGILETVNLDTLLGQWQSMLDEFVSSETIDFDEWFQDMKNQLTEDAAGHLQSQIDDIVDKSLTSNKTVYVSTTGSNVTGDGTINKPYRTITMALSVIPKTLAGYVARICVSPGTYAEIVNISDFYGGSIVIEILGDVTVNGLIITNSQRVRLEASTLYTITVNAGPTTAILVQNGADVHLNKININSTPIDQSPVVTVTDQSCFELTNGSLKVTNAAYAVVASEQSTVYIDTIAGSASCVIASYSGSSVSYSTRTIIATNPDIKTGGSLVTNDIGSISTLVTTIKTSIVDAINWMIGVLLPTNLSVSYILNKPTIPVYNQTYRYYSLPCRYANLYNVTNLSVTVVGLGGISSVSVVAKYTNAFLILDTSETGSGYPIQITATLTKI